MCILFTLTKKKSTPQFFRLYGLNISNQSVCLRVCNFTPYVYIELPLNKKIKTWTRHMAQLVSVKIEELLGYIKPLDPPTLTMMKKLYSPQTDAYGRPNMFPFLFCKFSCKRDIWALKKVLREPIRVPNIGMIHLKNTRGKCVRDITTNMYNKYSDGWMDRVYRSSSR